MTQDELKQAVARAAIAYVPSGEIIGVGTGSTANFFIDELGKIKDRIKGAVASSEATAARLKSHGITVFEIRPGIIRTDMIAAVEKTYDDKIANGLLPQRRMGESSDIAKAVRAVADGLLDYSTGQVLNLDGGFHLRSL